MSRVNRIDAILRALLMTDDRPLVQLREYPCIVDATTTQKVLQQCDCKPHGHLHCPYNEFALFFTVV